MSKFTKMNIVLLFFMLLTLVLMLIPYSVSVETIYTLGGEINAAVNTYAYFSLYPLLHYNCVPFISAIAHVAAVIIIFLNLFSKKKKNKIFLIFLLATLISIAASAITFFICKTLLSGIITGILFATCILFFVYCKTDF